MLMYNSMTSQSTVFDSITKGIGVLALITLYIENGTGITDSSGADSKLVFL